MEVTATEKHIMTTLEKMLEKAEKEFKDQNQTLVIESDKHGGQMLILLGVAADWKKFKKKAASLQSA